MNKWQGLVVVMFLVSSAQAGNLSVQPSAFFTYAAYSNEKHLSEGSVYTTFAWKRRHFLTACYDGLTIHDPDWTYHQDLGILATSAALKQGRWKTAGGLVAGQFKSKPFPYEYWDHAGVFSTELIYQWQRQAVGFEYARFDGTGFVRRRTDQVTLRSETLIAKDVGLQLRPNYTWASDGRHLGSLFAKFAVPVSRQLAAQVGGAVGRRAYYFDNDLLTLSNQMETQHELAFLRLDFALHANWTAMGEWLFTKFDGYSIAYYVAGLRARL